MARLEHTSIVGGERVDAIDHCLSGIARLQREVQDASSYVPSHDQRIYSQVRASIYRNMWYEIGLTITIYRL
jgi:hypothetical protein